MVKRSSSKGVYLTGTRPFCTTAALSPGGSREQIQAKIDILAMPIPVSGSKKAAYLRDTG